MHLFTVVATTPNCFFRKSRKHTESLLPSSSRNISYREPQSSKKDIIEAIMYLHPVNDEKHSTSSSERQSKKTSSSSSVMSILCLFPNNNTSPRERGRPLLS